MLLKSHTILYVEDQIKSTEFYTAVLNKTPQLFTPGMTEFELTKDAILGLMPKVSILKLLNDQLPYVQIPVGPLQAEIYLIVDHPEAYHQRALNMGAKNVSDLTLRNWGHKVAYCLDLDGYVLAFAADSAT